MNVRCQARENSVAHSWNMVSRSPHKIPPRCLVARTIFHPSQSTRKSAHGGDGTVQTRRISVNRELGRQKGRGGFLASPMRVRLGWCEIVEGDSDSIRRANGPSQLAVDAHMQRSAINRLRSLPAEKASFVEPMECLSVPRLPEGSQWLWEIKLDGYRALAVKSGSDVTPCSHGQRKSMSRQFPYIVEAAGRSA